MRTEQYLEVLLKPWIKGSDTMKDYELAKKVQQWPKITVVVVTEWKRERERERERERFLNQYILIMQA